MVTRIPCAIMRGGTSKCVMFHSRDLPEDRSLLNRILLAVMGSPDPRQINGLGGAFSTTSKVCIVGPPSVKDADVDYTFAQVSITDALVDFKGNCGNCSSAVGPFAIDEGLVEAIEPITTVRIYNTNTRKIIRAEVPVRNGKYDPLGTTYIAGVPAPGSRVSMWFDNPGGSLLGKLLPTGTATDVVDIPFLGATPISIVDAGNPVVFVEAERLGITGTEPPAFLDGNADFSQKIEAVRSVAAAICGFVPDWRLATKISPAVPKVAFVAPPRSYADLTGNTVAASEMDLLARMMSMQTVHRSYALTGAVATGAAAYIPGTVVNRTIPAAALASGFLRLGHPGGILDLEAIVELAPDGVEIRSVGSVRTARRIMDGFVYVGDALVAAEALLTAEQHVAASAEKHETGA